MLRCGVDVPDTTDLDDSSDRSNAYAVKLADGSFEWYRTRSIRSRRLYKSTEVSLIIAAALVPLSVVLVPKRPEVAALLGAFIVVTSGLKAIFRWHENYLRYSEAREVIEGERRAYHTMSEPYDDLSTRDQLLVRAVTKIEQGEMRVWMREAKRKLPGGN